MVLEKRILLGFLLLVSTQLFAQKIDYSNGLIRADGKDIAKVVKIKDKANFGLTNTFELHSLTGEKLIIAALSTEFAEAKDDNSSYYYRFSFLKENQTAIFTLSKLTTEKSFVRLLGESGIVVDNKLDPQLLQEFIASKSKNPRNAEITYNLVPRNRTGFVRANDNKVLQDTVVVGIYKDVTRSGGNMDSYEFSLPGGLVVARVKFAGGNNAKNFSVTTLKDKLEQSVFIGESGTYGTPIISSEGMDRNYIVMRKVAKWLVDKKYL